MNASLQRCLSDIETQLNWGPASGWSTTDFEALGDRIAEITGVHLSATTLKRVWGRVAYNSSPSSTTLDALARYTGHENWRARLAGERPPVAEDAESESVSRPNYRPWITGIAIMLVLFVGYLLIRPAPASAPKIDKLTIDPADYTFHHRPVTTGLPNSVIFTYDARAAPVDSVVIQQDWDPSRRERVDQNGSVHTAIYYQPGYYRATLRVGDREVRSRELLIPSDGWTVAVAGDDVPVYLPEVYRQRNGSLAVSSAQISELGLALQPSPPTVWMSHVGEFEGVTTDDFLLDTRLQQTYGEGAAACRLTKVLLLLRNSAIILPLSSAGCVADIGVFAGGRMLGGRENDLSAFGVLDGDWVDLSVRGKGELLSVFINDELALQLESREEPRDILGIRYEFTGGGAVDYLRLEGAGGEVWEEDFGLGK
jgi:hypothetical protein